MTKTKNSNIYSSVLPEPFKSNTGYIEGLDAMKEAIIGVLNLFIEVECANGEVPYEPKDDNYKFCEFEPYRGLIQGHVVIDKGFIKLADAYWFFKVEADEIRRELGTEYKALKAHDKKYRANAENDFLKRMNANRKTGKDIHEEDIWCENKLIKDGVVIDESLPAFVPYKVSSDKYTIMQVLGADGYVGSLEQKHIIEIAKNYRGMWC